MNASYVICTQYIKPSVLDMNQYVNTVGWNDRNMVEMVYEGILREMFK